MNVAQLAQIMKRPPEKDAVILARAQKWHGALVATMAKYEINTTKRIAAFLSQVLHESGGLLNVIEGLSYSDPARIAKIFRSGFDLDKDGIVDPAEIEFAKGYVKQPQKLANRAYANRMGNGNEASGDGYKFRGKGLIQLTGREDVTRFAKAIGKTADEASAYLETIEGACMSAGWYWADKGLNALADAGNIESVSKKVNGGTHGLDDRIAYYKTAMRVLS